MRTLKIEWRHYQKEGATCLRCSATGKTLAEVVDELKIELAPSGIDVILRETALEADQLPQSNLILIDGVPLETLLSGARTSTSECASCACLTGATASCRTVEYAGKSYEEIPEELIRAAVLQVLK